MPILGIDVQADDEVPTLLRDLRRHELVERRRLGIAEVRWAEERGAAAVYGLEQTLCGVELELRSQLYSARMESLMHQGKAVEALKLGEQAMGEFSKTAPLLVRLQLATAAIQQYHFKDFNAASKIYKAIIEQNNRVEHPNLVKVFTSGSDGEQWFYAMELVEGTDLASVCGQLAGSAAPAVGAEDWQRALTSAPGGDPPSYRCDPA